MFRINDTPIKTVQVDERVMQDRWQLFFYHGWLHLDQLCAFDLIDLMAIAVEQPNRSGRTLIIDTTRTNMDALLNCFAVVNEMSFD